jgi:iron complex outermembrane receptor protein
MNHVLTKVGGAAKRLVFRSTRGCHHETFSRHMWATLVVLVGVCSLLFANPAIAQESGQAEQLRAVEVEPPARTRRDVATRAGETTGGFGYDQPTPSGLPFSDFSLTSSEVVSYGGRPQNIATVPSAISVFDNKGIQSLGKDGLSQMVSGQPGVWSSGFAGNPFDAPIVIRGFSNESVNRVAVLLDGVNLSLPRQEVNSNFVFPEATERVEVSRGDAVIPFGDKAIGGAVNVVVKKPRQYPGMFFGAEGGSWGTNREWVSANLVRDSIAAGLFIGRYSQEGWRIHYGLNSWDEPVTRPGPWSLYNVQGSINWRIIPSLTFDISHLISDQRLGNYSSITEDRWERRDIRDVGFDVYDYRPFDDFPEERWDNVTIAKLHYEGGILGTLDITAAWRRYDRRIGTLLSQTIASDQRWTDSQLSLRYYRTDRWGFLRNDLTLGNDQSDGRFVREARTYVAGYPPSLDHSAAQRGGLLRLSYSLMNQTRLWDRLILGLGYRIENYDLKELYTQNSTYAPVRARIDMKKSASQYSFGFVYDRELGSSLYYRHARTYRFPNFDDMINLAYPFFFAHPDPIWLLQPEEGTLEEVGIRHWFTSNIYAGLTYYELDMDNEIYFGPDPALAGLYSRNLNVPLISHSGIELEMMARITPRWTARGNYTRQKVIFRSNWQPFDALRRTTEDKWLTINPAEMANLSLEYKNAEWGFSMLWSLHYLGSRYMINDIFNEYTPLAPAAWGDVALSQKIFDNAATVYFGINNLTDLQYAVQGSLATVYPPPFYSPTQVPTWWPDAGRTIYCGLKTSTDFHQMRLPTEADLRRMYSRLYGAVNRGVDAFSGKGSRLQSWIPFNR